MIQSRLYAVTRSAKKASASATHSRTRKALHSSPNPSHSSSSLSSSSSSALYMSASASASGSSSIMSPMQISTPLPISISMPMMCSTGTIQSKTFSTAAIASTNGPAATVCRPSSLAIQVQPLSLSCMPTSTSTSTSTSPSQNIHNHKHGNHNVMTKRNKVFVSRHNQSLHITSNQITDYCSHHGIGSDSTHHHNDAFRITNTHVQIKECPFCTRPTNGKADNHYKLYVQIGGGAYFCHRCGSKGSWYDFKMKLGGYDVVDSMGRSSGSGSGSGSSTVGNGNGSGYGYGNAKRRNNNGNGNGNGTTYGNPSQSYAYAPNQNYKQNQNTNANHYAPPPSSSNQKTPMPSPRLQAAYITNLLDNNNPSTSTTKSQKALEYLITERGLTKQTLRKYGVGLGSYNFPSTEPSSGSSNHNHRNRYVRQDCITFPWIMRASEIHEQEVLRGGSYHWNNTTTDDKKKKNGDDEHTTDTDADKDAEEERYGPYITRRIKARSLTHKAHQRLDPPGGGWGLFGWHTVPHDATEIILTEGEYDAMAVHQATGRAAVSLPNGCRSLPVEVLPMLERFEKVILWMDNDGPGREGAEMFAKKIGVNRCFIVTPDTGKDGDVDVDMDVDMMKKGQEMPKDANEALLKGMDLEKMIRGAEVLPHERILTFRELRSQVIHEMLNPEKYAGVPVPSLPGFTNILKGFRRGEVTVLTGPTGSGKTTFLGQLSLDFAENGVNTLWGSFEIKNTRLMHKLLQQFSRGPMPSDRSAKVQALEVLADRFENLPLYFMKFHGGSDIDDVLDAMEYAAYVHDVQHIILDNMQFMISRNSPKYNSSFDKFDIQDIAIEKFRKFATEKNIHVTLVVHPRKEEEGMKLGMSSVYGSAKATQEADNVLILQKDPSNENRKYVEVKKNRYDGTLGMSPLYFQFDSKRYSEQQYPDAKVPDKNFANRPAAAVAAASTPRSISMNNGRTFVSAAPSKPRSTAGAAATTSKTKYHSTYSSILED